MNTVPSNKCAISQLSLTIEYENLHYNVKIGKLVNFVYVSLLYQQGNGDFEFISVCFSVTGYIRYQHTISLKSYVLMIGLFSFLFVAVST